jgi:EAL domain-containing protein (putative c-di-GMP-specific phosphodiesterase class I)
VAQAREFEEILRRRVLQTDFQPIVRLDSGESVGYEALVRGPAGTQFASADALLALAYQTGRVVEFDWVARASASRAALKHELRADRLLFLNVEPLALGTECPPDLWPDIEQAFARFQVVLEVTERTLARDPSALLAGIDHQRPEVAGIALDDVGSRTATLSMLPVLSVDVIKLDLAVTQGGTSAAAMKVLDIAYEEAERTGATILAEGIETADHVRQARSFGANLGQGYYLGEPRPLPDHADEGDVVASVASGTVDDVATPFDALAGRPTSRATAELLVPLSRQVVLGETDLAEPALVVDLVPEPAVFGPEERRTLMRLARRGVVTGALGRGTAGEPVDGVRGALVHDRSLDGQWTFLALSPSNAGAMLARAVPGTAEYEFGITHDRRRVVTAARCLLRRLGPPPVSANGLA